MASFGCLGLPRKVDNSCISIGTGPGPVPIDDPCSCLSAEKFCEDFSEMNLGDTTFNLLGMTVTTGLPGNPPMIFNTGIPTAGDTMLGTPNMAFAGPGVGAGGAAGAGINDMARGNALIISENNDSANPLSRAAGGLMTFTFTEPISPETISLVDVDEGGWQIEMFGLDGLSQDIFVPTNLGTNSFQILDVTSKLVTKMEVTFGGKGAITEFCYLRNKAAGTDVGYVTVIDDGTLATELPNGKTFGSYKLIVESVLDDGAKATFEITKSQPGLANGSVVRVSHSFSITDEQIHAEWLAGLKPALRHSVAKTGATGALIPYKYSLIRTL